MGIVTEDRPATRSPATETIRAALRMAHSHDLSKRSVLLGLWQAAVSTILEAATSRSDACRTLVRHAQAIKGEGSNADSQIMPSDTPTARRRVAEATEATKLIGACLDVFLESLTSEGRRDEFPGLIVESAFGILSDIWGPRHLRKAIAAQVQQLESGADSPILPDEPVTTNTASPGLPTPPPSHRVQEAGPRTVARSPHLPAPAVDDAPPPPMDGPDVDAPPPPDAGDDDGPAFEDEGFTIRAADDGDPVVEPMDAEGEDALASLLALADEEAPPPPATEAEAAAPVGDDVGEDDLLGLLDIPEPPHVPVLEDDADELPEPVARKGGEGFRPFMTTKEAERDDALLAEGPADLDAGPTEPAADAIPPPGDDPAPPSGPDPSVGPGRGPVDGPAAEPSPLPDPASAASHDLGELPAPLREAPFPVTRVAALEPPSARPREPAVEVAAPVPPRHPGPVAEPTRPAAPGVGDGPSSVPAERVPAERVPGVRERLSASHRDRRMDCCLLVADDEAGNDGVFAAVISIRSADGMTVETRELSGRMAGIVGRRAILHACRETLARLGAPAQGERVRFSVESDLIYQGATNPAKRLATAVERGLWDDIESLCAGRSVEWNRRRPGLGSGPGERCDRLIRAAMRG